MRDIRGIALLPPELQNQIAAGEVVERPASVLKELIENALDAGATRIRIHIQDGGQSFIHVSDNGSGISPHEMELALTRHATSKLETLADLQNIHSFGFRGEALPSIASVSRFRLTSSVKNGEGQLLEVIHGRIVGKTQTAVPQGTEVEVSDLFANIPARLKFLKQPATESRKCSDIVARMALAHVHVDFEFLQGQRQVFHFFKDQTLAQRLSVIWPQSIVQGMRKFSHTDDGYTIHGLTGDPATAQARADRIFIYINSRPVQDKIILSAVREAYRGKILGKEYPQTIIFLDLPADEIDVNVHPAKTEIRFQDERAIFRLVRRAILHALEQDDQTMARSFQETSAVSTSSPALPALNPWTQPEKNLEENSPVYGAMDKFTSTKKAQLLFADVPDFVPVQLETPATPQVLGTDSLTDSLTISPRETSCSVKYLGQFDNTYLLLIENNELVLIDQHAAHERILFEVLKEQGMRGDRQPLLIPLELTIHPSQSETLQGLWTELRTLGFELELSSSTHLHIQAIPPLLKPEAARELVQDISLGKARSIEDLWSLMACRGAVKAQDALTSDEALALIEAWNQLKNKDYCPHGRPVAIRWSVADLEKLFKRRG